jgi:hypothetical protein
MKKLLSISMMLVVMMSLVGAVAADSPAPGGPFATAFRVQNLSATEVASCSYVFYDSAGTATFTSTPENVNPGDSLYVYTPTLGGLSAGTYSGVVSCSQPVAAVVNFSDLDSGASHNGISADALSSTWYAPGIYDNFFNFYSNLIVQNAASGPVNVTVDIFAPGNPVAVKQQTFNGLAVNASHSFEQEGLAELSQDVAYSAKIVSTGGSIAVIANIYGRGVADNQLYSYNAFPDGATQFYVPIVMNNYYGNNTSVAIQNIDSLAADVTITYSDGTVKNTTIQPNSADSRYTPIEGVPSGDANGLLGATIVSTNGKKIVVLVNLSNPFNRAASYDGFSVGSHKVNAPIVLKRYFDFNSSVVCQNISGAATTMTLTYGGVGGSDVSPSINPGAIYQFYQPASALIADGFIGSATVTASQNIVCVINQDTNEGSFATQIWDQQYSYNGINN